MNKNIIVCKVCKYKTDNSLDFLFHYLKPEIKQHYLQYGGFSWSKDDIIDTKHKLAYQKTKEKAFDALIHNKKKTCALCGGLINISNYSTEEYCSWSIVCSKCNLLIDED